MEECNATTRNKRKLAKKTTRIKRQLVIYLPPKSSLRVSSLPTECKTYSKFRADYRRKAATRALSALRAHRRV